MIPQRYVLALLGNLGLLLVNCMRASLSVAIVAMVNITETGFGSITDEDCPQYFLASNSSATSVKQSGEFNWSRELQGFILSSFYWGYIVLQVPGGTLAQRYGGKWIFAAGILCTTVFTLLTPVVARLNVYFFIVTRFLEGVGEGVTNSAIMAMLGRWCPRQEGSVMFSVVNVGSFIGPIIGQVITGPLAVSTFLGGWPSVFYVTGVCGLLWLIPWCLLVYDSPEKHPRISSQEKNYILDSVGGSQEEANKEAVPWKHILRSRYVWVYSMTYGISSLITYALLNCLPQFLSDVLKLDIVSNGLVASLPYLPFVILINVFAWISEVSVTRGWIRKTNVRKIFSVISLGGVGVCLLAVTFTTCNRAAVIFFLVLGYALFSAAGAGFATNALDLSPEYSGAIFGFANVIATVSGVIAPIITDAVTKHRTAYEWNLVFYGAFGICVGTCFLYVFFSSADYQNWNFNEDEAKWHLLMNEEVEE